LADHGRVMTMLGPDLPTSRCRHPPSRLGR
jgi:hypothetical protein